MAKRAAPDEQPYRPLLDAGLVSAAMAQPSPAAAASTIKEVSVSRSAPKLSLEPARADLPRPGEGRGRFETQPPARMPPEKEAAKSFIEKFDQEKRILFTRTETQAIDRLVTSLA